MPTYKCGNDCPYCYLSAEDRHYGGNVNMGWYIRTLKDRFEEISGELMKISNIELYGGDLGTIPHQDLYALVEFCREYTSNISITHTDVDACLKMDFEPRDINLSLNIERRDFQENLRKSRRNPDVGIITVVTNDVCNRSMDELFNSWYKHLTGYLTFMPLSNAGCKQPFPFVSNTDYCAFIIRALEYYHTHMDTLEFVLTNSIQVHDALNGLYSAHMGNNVFITPGCDFAAVVITKGSEEFHRFHDFKEWKDYAAKDDINYGCECGGRQCYYSCLADHFISKDNRGQFEEQMGDICNGGIPIIEWAKQHPEYGYGVRGLDPFQVLDTEAPQWT